MFDGKALSPRETMDDHDGGGDDDDVTLSLVVVVTVVVVVIFATVVVSVAEVMAAAVIVVVIRELVFKFVFKVLLMLPVACTSPPQPSFQPCKLLFSSHSAVMFASLPLSS